MSRKNTLAKVGLSALFIALSFITGYLFAYNLTPHTSTTPQLKEPTTAPLEQLPVIIESTQPKILILPVNYVLTKEDINAIQKGNISLVITDQKSESYINQIKEQLPKVNINEQEGSSYTYCKKGQLSIDSETDNKDLIVPDYISKGDCTSGQKILIIEKLLCDIKDTSCQKKFVNLQMNRTQQSYIYSPLQPLFSLFDRVVISVDNPYGTHIFTWKSPVYPFEIDAYSIELIDSGNKRVFASGKIATATNGDYFSSTQELPAQKLTAKVRFWYKYGSTTFSEPHVVESIFEYNNPTNDSFNASTSTPKHIAWIPDWGMSEGIESIRKNPKKWDSISPVWFVPNKNGTLNKKPTLNSPALLKLLKDNNIKLIPTISTFDADTVKEILNKNLDKHVDEIVRLVEKNGYDGIDLDYESTYENDKELLIQFVTKLAGKLHEKGKILSFTALPKIDDRRIYSFLPQTHVAQDWKAIGAVVDEFRIMAYDFTGQGSLQPGPLSPVQWNETLIRYAIAQMPREKVVLALPLYSHGWPKPKSTNLAGEGNNKSLSSGELKNTISLQHDSIEYVQGHSSYYRERYDPWTKEVRAEFKYNGIERIMFYLNKQGLDNRVKLAEKYGIKGVCYWRIGGEKL